MKNDDMTDTKNTASIWINLTEEQKKGMTPEAFNKLWDMLTDEQRAEITAIAAASQYNCDLERCNNHGAPDLTGEEV